MESGDSESLQERQENELQVLHAIFMDEFCDLRKKDAWKVHRPPEVQITLTPQQGTSNGNEVHAQVDLHVKCGPLYPEQIPDLELKNAKGLSNQTVAKLKEELMEVAKKLQGEVMILELAQYIQNFLHGHNQPRFKSFYEEMLSNQRKQEEELAKEHLRQLELQRQKEDKQRKAIEEEIVRKQEALKEEARLRKESCKQANSNQLSTSPDPLASAFMPHPTVSPIHPVRRERSHSIETITPIVIPATKQTTPISRRRQSTPRSEDSPDHEFKQCRHSGIRSLTFNTRGENVVQRGKCLGHSSRGSVTFVGLDATTGELVTIVEWVLKWRHFTRKQTTLHVDLTSKEQEGYLKQVSSIEKEIVSLLRLRHNNLVHYKGMRISHEKDSTVIQILQEFVTGCDLSHHFSEGPPCDTDLLRHYTVGICDALSFLHMNSVVHKDLRDTSIFLDNSGLVRMCDYSIDKRLAELCAAVNKETLEDTFPPSLGRGAKKADVYRLGIILLSLAKGEIITEVAPEVPTNLRADLVDFLKKCLTSNEQKRWTVDQLKEHAFLKPSLEQSIQSNEVQEKNPEQTEEVEEPEREIPFLAMPSVSGQSRLQNEFQVLKWLGKGGFGDVLKVRNQLDGRIYAIKRIMLKRHNKQLNKKITREVKLLSRLNHENVVRYFYSWIETISVDKVDQTANDGVTSGEDTSSPRGKTVSDVVPAVEDDIERLAPARVDTSLEWSISLDHVTQPPGDDESSSDDDEEEEEEEEDVFGTSYFLHSTDSSDGVIFQNEGTSKLISAQDFSLGKTETNDSTAGDTLEDGSKLIRFMYIQMEFCEKSTLRNIIDAGLHEDQERMWRLFREIIEGLVHIHQQGMIHRDLKPVNIFLDSNDHVKIGDFGLATTDIIAKTNIVDCTASSIMEPKGPLDMSRSDPIEDSTLTGRVGTALYVAPELNSAVAKTVYTQKVDIYSLGIIFFEMCYRPLSTAMERVKILGNVRLPDVVLPPDFEEAITPQQITIICWLLNHDPTQRPTSLELLQSEYLPPPQMEEAELQDMLRHTINNPQSKLYKHMISALFKQEISAAAEFTYDMDIHKRTFNSRATLTHKYVRELLSKLFAKHGAINIITPLLIPKTQLYDCTELTVNVIDHGGGVISLPYELRVSFARYVVKNNISNLKRYCISRVFRERKVYGCHPRELFECAFDIVTPNSGSLLADAEVLSVVGEIISEFQVLQNRSYTFRLNHTSLIKAIFLYCGIPEEKHNDVYGIISSDSKTETANKFQIQTRLMNLCLSDSSVAMLYNFVEMEGSLSKVSTALKSLTKKKGPASSLAKQGLHELETVIGHAEALGLKVQVLVTPGLVYSIHQFCGIFFKVVCQLKKKHRKNCLDVLAAGGRYDPLISAMRLSSSIPSGKEYCQSAVGASIALEKIVLAVLEDEEFSPPAACDVLVCSIGHRPLLKEKCNLLRDLWAVGIKVQLQYESAQSLEEVQDFCKELGILHIVIFKDAEAGAVKVRSWDKDRFTEKKMMTSELPEYFQKLLSNRSDSVDSPFQVLSRSDSAKSCTSNEQLYSSSGTSDFSIKFVVLEKLAPHLKRRHEAQIASHVSSVLQYISPKTHVQIIAVELNAVVLKTIASMLELDGSETNFKSSLIPIIEKHPRHRKYLTEVFDQLYELKFQNRFPVLMLYGLPDNSYKLLL